LLQLDLAAVKRSKLISEIELYIALDGGLEMTNLPVRSANSNKFVNWFSLFNEKESVFKIFEKYITEKAILSRDDLDLIRKLCIEKTIKKHQFLLREGEICRYNTFVTKGCLLSYRVDASGIEHALRFSIENWWASDQESLTNGTSANCNIEALEDTEVVMWTKGNFEHLKREIHNQSFRKKHTGSTKQDLFHYQPIHGREIRNLHQNISRSPPTLTAA
jgi:hypothetical protein